MKLQKRAHGYGVFADDGTFLGTVIRVTKASHIRRGREQVNPWWRPIRPDGEPAGEVTRAGVVVDYQNRITAVEFLTGARVAP